MSVGKFKFILQGRGALRMCCTEHVKREDDGLSIFHAYKLDLVCLCVCVSTV